MLRLSCFPKNHLFIPFSDFKIHEENSLLRYNKTADSNVCVRTTLYRMDKKRTYLCIDLKSFYASVECVRRNLDPLTTNLVVADSSRTEKTICLAVSPALKKYGIPGRPRLFEVVRKVDDINLERLKKLKNKSFTGDACDSGLLAQFPSLKLNYIVALPHMKDYIDVSSKIYGIYLKYVAKEDIHVYSIDEVFMDVTDYLSNLKMSAHELCMTIIKDVLKNTGITATGGIGSNLYLAKVGMDIVAKHVKADKDGVRIAELDEMTYRQKLWEHRPLNDFWRVGKGYERRLNALGLYTMGDIAKCSCGTEGDFYNEDLLYKEFGVNAELLIDHAWGYEPTTIKDIKEYRPLNHSLSVGQVLHRAYTKEEGKTIVYEMAEDLSLQLFSKHLVTKGLELWLDYDHDNLNDSESMSDYQGALVRDYLGRTMPKPSHGKVSLKNFTSSTSEISESLERIYDDIMIPFFRIRKLRVVALEVIDEKKCPKEETYQMSLFDCLEPEKGKKQRKEDADKEKRVQKALLSIRDKYGKNSVLKAVDYKEEATGRERNNQIGGHKA